MNYKVQVSSENLRKTASQNSTSLVISRRMKTDKGSKYDVLDVIKEPLIVFFPKNTGQLLSSKFYSQLREWYFYISVLNTDRTKKY